jgi:glycosyltransferase involved in cell wall biosynthesis
MKIAVVTSYFRRSNHPYGGNSAFHTLRFLKRHAEIEVICPLAAYPKVSCLAPKTYERPDLTYRPPELKTSYFEYPAIPIASRPLNGRTCARLLLPYLRAFQPDLILSYWIYPDGYSAVRVGQILGVPAIVGAIGSDVRRRNDPVTRYLVRKTMLEAAGVITVSEELRQRAIALGIPPGKVTTILNGCDASVFYPGDRDQARRLVSCDGNGELILYVGNLIRSKGLAELMDAFSGLLKSRPGVRLALIGKGAYGETILRRAAAAGVGDRLMMLGHQGSTTVAHWMRAADVFCLPSYSEGCANVIIEALVCGRPVVATNVGGIPELIDESCGILVPAHDSGQLQLALQAALSRQWDTNRIARQFKRSWEDVADETLAVCRKVLDSARKPDAIIAS